jgi:hypothetical protein
MTGWIRFPWGTEKMGDRANPARWFCWQHYVAGTAIS